MRLPRLSGRDVGAIATVLRVIGGHPRVLEFLDALLRGGEGRFPAVSEKLRDIAKGLKLDLATAPSVGFAPVEGREVVAAFDGGAITSDAGALLLGGTDRAIGMTERLRRAFTMCGAGT